MPPKESGRQKRDGARSKQLAAKAATNSPSPRLEESQQQPFPLMALAGELREKIYGEILRPSDRDHHDRMLDPEDPDESEQIGIEAEELQVAIKDAVHQTNFLSSNKEVRAEATKVWYNTHWFVATITGSNISLEESFTEKGTLLLSPRNLDKIRNLQITLKGLLMLHRLDLYTLHAISYLTQLCYDLSIDCPLLRNVVVQVPCGCSWSERAKERQISRPPPGRYPTEEDFNCPSEGEWGDLLRPLSRLRVRKSVKLETSCRNSTNRVQSVFDRMTADARKLVPVPALAGNERTWYDVRCKAFESKTRNGVELRRTLHEAQMASNIPLNLRQNTEPTWNYAHLWQGRFNWWMGECERLMRDAEYQEKAVERRSRKTRQANLARGNNAAEEDEEEAREAVVAAPSTSSGRMKRKRHHGEFRSEVPKGLEIDMNW
ncbi:MAG: hypothetical protein Q9208_006014 [Pyrenodesmia sp. 3 TL-2023]